MVTLHFKMSELGYVSVDIKQPEPLKSIVTRTAAGSDFDLGSCIVIRNGRIIDAATIITDGDEISILPALAGG